MELLIALAIFPGLAISFYIWWRDKHEREPHKYLIWCFIFGILSTIPAFYLEVFGESMGITMGPDMVMTFIYAVFVIGLSEELCKFVFLRYYIYPKDEFCEPMDGIVYAVMISMGFATFENVLYVMQSLEIGGMDLAWDTAIKRMLISVPAHASFAVIMGYFVGMAKFAPTAEKRFSLLNTGLAASILTHGLFDFFIMQQNFPSLAILTLGVFAVAVILSMRMIKTHVENSPHNGERPKTPIDELYSEKEEEL
jgi:RsiW-degrading membrane proteinase PrsW (M82 family)